MSEKSRYNVIGIEISSVTMEQAVDTIVSAISSGSGGYVCFANVHTTVMARQDDNYKGIIENSLMSVPDGRPLYWTGIIKGIKNIEHLPGPDFMPNIFAYPKEKPLKHYFYGSTKETINKLVECMKIKFPTEIIAGYESPPFRIQTEDEKNSSIEKIIESGADIVWVGLGAPKQEIWMNDNWEKLRPAVLMGVGAAFDFNASLLDRAPELMSKLGLEWFYRFCKEPARLWKRYVVTNSIFISYCIKELVMRVVKL